jgi:hypothetical protein
MRSVGDIARRALGPVSAVVAAASFCAVASAAVTLPTVTTGAVTAFTATTATVSGTINPNGDATSWHFDYGKTATYGSTTISTSVGAGTVSTGVSATLTGLSPGTTYHYRLVATNGGGTTNGTDGVFNTSTASPPAVTTSAATAVGQTTATLNGSINANGRPTTYYFEYGRSTSYGTKTGVQNGGSATNTVVVSAGISGLQPGESYHFRLVATSDVGTTPGADMTFTASAAPAAPPTVTTRPASSISSSGARLNGTVNPNGRATTYYFEYGTSTSYGSKTTAASAGSGTRTVNVSATVSGLGPGVNHFRLVATSSAGTSTGNDLTFGSSAPPVVQTGTAQGTSTSGVTLTGSVNPQGGSTSWWFQYGPTASYGSTTPSKSAGSALAVTGVSAAIVNLRAGTTYHYRLAAKNNAGTTYGSDVTFTTVAALTLVSSTTQVVYGRDATLSGAVSSRQSGTTVTILEQPFGSTSFRTIGTTLTGAGGSWTFRAKPAIQTTYEASTTDGTSTTAVVGVRPAASLRVITNERFSTRVVAGSSFAGKTVQLQRLLPGNRWQTVSKTRLNGKSSAIFSAAKLPRGTSTIRVAMSVNQAGPGYLGAFSRTINYRLH